MKDLIFETLMIEAQTRVSAKLIFGVGLEEAIDQVAEFMVLEDAEIEELKTRSKKAPMPKNQLAEEEPEEAPELTVEEDPIHQIKFNDHTELDAAIGVLMYKGIPWVNKGSDFVSFESGDLMKEAHEALKRRWDFINADDRTVATIAFDNITDYNKVLDFIAGKNMTVLMDSQDDLHEDLDLKIAEDEANFKKATKVAKAEGLDAPLKPTNDLNYRALHKDKLVDVKGLDPVSDAGARSIRVVKRWK